MEVTAEGILSPFQGLLSPESHERSSQRVQSPDEVCKLLQNIQADLPNDQELASYSWLHWTCASLKSTSQTPGMTETLKNSMNLVESKISCHLHKVRLLGSLPIKTCNIHYPPPTSHNNPKLNSLSKQNPLKRMTAEDRDFQLPSKRSTVKAATFFPPNAITTSNKFMNLENLTEPDPPLPQAPKITPIMTKFNSTDFVLPAKRHISSINYQIHEEKHENATALKNSNRFQSLSPDENLNNSETVVSPLS
ncbi:hypothetical protein CDAR_176901 [Caerostris darwini]|uniref:Uncharacterized protein n=1 Tax=Caerostris darwini TaxID=1538125 RepID=A0AAV4RIT2_9ARAC|nr:hypothetical protein CDAR_176901 [Caerostris darwini]